MTQAEAGSLPQPSSRGSCSDAASPVALSLPLRSVTAPSLHPAVPRGRAPFSLLLTLTQELPQTRTPRLGSLRAGLRVPINPGSPWGRPVPGPSGCFLLEAACAWWLLHLQQIPSIFEAAGDSAALVSSCLDGPGPDGGECPPLPSGSRPVSPPPPSPHHTPPPPLPPGVNHRAPFDLTNLRHRQEWDLQG